MYFPAKKEIWFSLIIWGVILFMILIYIFGGEPVGQQFITYKSILGYIIGALILILLLWVWFGTCYQIKGNLLLVKMGPFKSKIYIKEIRKIRSIKNPNKSSNLSAHKLEILIGKYDVIKISPNNRSKLIQSLLGINPDIQIDVTSIVSDK